MCMRKCNYKYEKERENGQMLGNDKETDRPTDERTQDERNRETKNAAKMHATARFLIERALSRSINTRRVYGENSLIDMDAHEFVAFAVGGWNFTSLSLDDVDKNGSIVVRASHRM